MNKIVFSLLLFEVFCVDCFSIRNTDERLISETKYGKILGSEKISVGTAKKFYSFESIPFAKPPVGSLRFEPPQTTDRWEDVLETTTSPSPCIQTDNSIVVGREDCLYLNIYTPILPSEGTKEPLPVMVWIYGGGFEGGANHYEMYGPDYLIEKDVIIVSINYRLGIFGFLSTGDEVVPGNNGIRDVILGLKWVRDNIRYFGGDQKKVTIFGQSAGSAISSYLVQSPLAKGLFQQAILQSGVSLSLWAKSRTVTSVARSIGRQLNITTTNSRELVDQLKEIETVELQTVAKAVSTSALVAGNPRDGFIFAPVIEPAHSGAVMSEKSHMMLRVGQFNTVPIMMGYTTLEGYFNVTNEIRFLLRLRYDAKPGNLVPIDMNIKDSDTKTAVGKIIKQHYFGTTSIGSSGIEINIYITEDMFVRPIQEFARQILSYVPVYFYRFAYQGTLAGLRDRILDGVAHSEDLAYLFRSRYVPTADDAIIRERMTTAWTNFAKYGNPTPTREPLFENKLWLPANSAGDTNLVYMNIDKTLTVGVNPEGDNMNFWKDLYEKYAEGWQDTY